MGRFRYLKPGVGIILAFVGVKMILIQWVHLPVLVSLAVILTVLTGSILLSLRRLRHHPDPGDP
jgi:tellurite resistance protein TerC